MKFLPTLIMYLICEILLSNAQNYNGCFRYYYSNGVLCCYKGTTNSPISYCPSQTQPFTTSPYTAATSCSSYSYSTTYSTKCCEYKSTSQHNSYNKYCPTKSLLASLCPGTTSCCTANVPVSVAGTTFYYAHRFCSGPGRKSESSISVMSAYICGIIIIVSSCVISAAIITIVLINKYRNKRIGADTHSETTIDRNSIASGLEESVPSYEQVMMCIEVPPQIPGYTFTGQIVNTSHQQIELTEYTGSITYANVNAGVQDV